MSERYDGQTYYELLEITPNSGPGEIYNAYQRARTTYSPSSPALYSMFTPAEAQELLVMIEEAYQTLSHQARRREYDERLGLVGPAQPPRSTMTQAAPSAPRAEAAVAAPVLVKVMPKKDELPSGFARTKFSIYEVKPEMEQEIASIEECDGKFLQRVRLYSGVTLEQLSDEIRVVKSTLVALEANDLDALPVAVFTRGFVIQAARAMGFDEKKITDAYMKFFKARKVVK